MSLKLGNGMNHCRRLFAHQREFGFGGSHFSLEEFVVGMQLDSQPSTSFASSKPVSLQMSCKPEDTKELANEEIKQFDPGGGRGEPPL